MRILITLPYDFNYDLRCYYESKSLIKAGHEVTVLVWDKKRENILREVREGVNIVRICNTKFMDLIPYEIFRLRFWWNEGYKKALELHKENCFDAVQCYNLDTLPIGIKLKKKLGLSLVYDAREIWGYMLRRDLPECWSNYHLWKEKHLLKYVDEITTVNEPLKKYFSKITSKPITIVMNCKPLQETKYNTSNNDIFTLLYIGVLGKPRFLLELVDVVKEIHDVRCIIAGAGSKMSYVKDLERLCSESKNVEFLGRVPMENVLPMTKEADVVVHMVNPEDLNNKIGLANKQFEAMVCGRPIIVTKKIYAGELTEKLQCGLIIEFNKKSLKEAIIKLKNNPELCKKLGENALKAAIEEYNWEKQEEKLINVYKELEKNN